MKEEISMNQKIIKVFLIELDSATDVLRFQIDEDTYFDINLNDSGCQNALRKVFSGLLEILIKSDVKLEFEVSEGYERKMYIEVCQEYVDDLNRELKESAEKIREEIE